MPYYADKISRFALPYGINNLHSGNGKLIRSWTEIVGNELQVTIQVAFALGILHSIRKVTYDGVEIASQYFQFYKGEPGEVASEYVTPGTGIVVPSFFADDVNHWQNDDPTKPGASFANLRLPVGMKIDGDPNKAVFQLECREVGDYNSAGSQTDFGYSTNPARCAVDGIQIIEGNLDSIEWGSFDEYKAWCAEQIPIVKDGETIYVDRFRLDAFFMPPFGEKQFLDRIMQLTCSDYQERKGKIRFIPATDREPVFAFDLTNLALDYKFQPINGDNDYNGVRVSYRDLDDDLLREAEPIVVDRRPLDEDGKPDINIAENFYELNGSNSYHDQAERVGNYWAKNYCDLKDVASIKGSFKSYVTLPCDIVTILHPTPAWNNKRVKIIKKTEREDRQSADGIEKFDGYAHYVRVEPENPYSDTDFTPIETRTPVAGFNPFAAPPLPTLTVLPDSVAVADGSTTNAILGTVSFVEFGVKQTVKIFWMKPGEGYEFLTDLTPDSNQTAVFRAPNPPSGVNYFKAVPYSEYLVPNQNLSSLNQKSITVNPSIFYIDGVAISPAALRALLAIRSDNRVIGRDTTIVPQNAIQSSIDTAEIIGENVMCVIAVSIADLAGGAHNQADSANVCQVDVFNQFGEFIKSFAPSPITLKAATATSSFPRKYADAKEGQCYFRIKIYNAFNWSNAVYLQGSTLSTSPPALKSRSNCPLELGASPVSATVIQITFQFGSSCNLYRRLVGETAWTQHVTGISGSPFNATDFSESTEYELQLRSASNEANRSNIRRVRTKQQPPAPPTRTAPTSLDGSPNSGSPTSQIDVSWVRNATDNVNVEVWLNGSLHDTVADDQTWYNFTGLSSGTSYTMKVRNKWGSSDFSAFSNEKTISTENPPPPPEEDPRPEITSGEYDTSAQAMYVYFDKHGNAGNFTVDRNSGGVWSRLYTNTIPNSSTFFAHGIEQTSFTQYIGYRVARFGTGGFWEFGNEMYFEIPPGDPYEPPWELP